MSPTDSRTEYTPQGHVNAIEPPDDQAAVEGLAVAPAPRRANPVLAFLRNTWRGLTSMRTALILLFLLAVASLPGAMLPQFSLNAAKTQRYISDHGAWGTVLNRLGFFEVFASPWYSAIYLLLFISLIGCLLPRSLEFAQQLRAVPVRTPRNLARLPLSASSRIDAEPDAAAARVGAELKRRRWRVVIRPETDGAQTVSAEKGYLREVGNLIFHFSLVGLLIAIAVGKLFGYEGSVIREVGAGQEWCSTSTSTYDNFRPGLTVDGTDLDPFCLQLQSFHATWGANGQPLSFETSVGYQRNLSGPGSESWSPATIQVNHPLRLGSERIYLLGHGYAPVFTVTYPDGAKREYSAPFVSNDPMFTSTGAIKITDPPGVPAAELGKYQLAIEGVFAPSALDHQGVLTSMFPAVEKPGVAIRVYQGDLGMETGAGQSVFTIDQSQKDSGALVRKASKNLYLNESVTLDDGTTIAFTGVRDWVSLQTSYDPGQFAALICAITLLIGLMMSLIIKRRRLWFRFTPAAADLTHPEVPTDDVRRTVVDVGGLARTDQAGYGSEFDELAKLAQDPATRREKG